MMEARIAARVILFWAIALLAAPAAGDAPRYQSSRFQLWFTMP